MSEPGCVALKKMLRVTPLVFLFPLLLMVGSERTAHAQQRPTVLDPNWWQEVQQLPVAASFSLNATEQKKKTRRTTGWVLILLGGATAVAAADPECPDDCELNEDGVWVESSDPKNQRLLGYGIFGVGLALVLSNQQDGDSFSFSAGPAFNALGRPDGLEVGVRFRFGGRRQP